MDKDILHMGNDMSGGENDLVETLVISVDKGQEALRIDKFLMGRMEKVSRSLSNRHRRFGYIFRR